MAKRVADRAAAGPSRITMGDIATEAGVSAMTVSRVLRRSESVSPVTRERVLEIIERLGFVPDQTAGTLSSRQSGFVAMVVPSVNNSNFSDTARGLMFVLRGAGLQLLVAFSDYSVEQEEDAVETMLKRRPEGIILAGARAKQTPRTRHLLKMSKIPVIETWDIPDRPVGHVVGFSNFQASYATVEHLWARGYRRIAFLGGTAPGSRGNKRLAGYTAALEKLGSQPVAINSGPLPATMQQGQRVFPRLMEQMPDVDAVVCVSDLLAFGFLMECNRQGVAVPGEIAVAGFGDFDVGRWCYPTLTTVQVGSHEMGVRAGELMLKAIGALRQGAPLKPMILEARVTVIHREST